MYSWFVFVIFLYWYSLFNVILSYLSSLIMFSISPTNIFVMATFKPSLNPPSGHTHSWFLLVTFGHYMGDTFLLLWNAYFRVAVGHWTCYIIDYYNSGYGYLSQSSWLLFAYCSRLAVFFIFFITKTTRHPVQFELYCCSPGKGRPVSLWDNSSFDRSQHSLSLKMC